MNYTNEVGVFTRVTAAHTGLLAVGVSGSKAALLGILVGTCGAGATAPTVHIWEGQVTGATTIIGPTTLTRNAFTRIPAYCSGGASVWISGVETPDLTIYWNPLG